MHKGDTVGYNVNKCAAGRRQRETGYMERKRKKGTGRLDT